MKNKNNIEYKNIIFDLVGVLFSLDKLKIFYNIGMLKTAFYISRYRKNPIDVSLSVLDKMARDENQKDRTLKYKNCLMPKCVYDFNLGIKTGQETMREIQEYIGKLGSKNYFLSDLEKTVATNVLKTFFDSNLIQKAASPIKQTVEIVKNVKKSHNVFLLSNIDRETFYALHKKHERIFSLFDGMVLSCQERLLKPDHAIFKSLTERYQLNPKECIFIDDQKENVEAAQIFGINSILYQNPHNIKKELEDFDITL